MIMPCANSLCDRPIGREAKRHRTNLCLPCRWRLTKRLIPTCGLIPSLALQAISKDLLTDIKPTLTDLTAAMQIMRGPRYRNGIWADRPVYRNELLHVHSPRVPLRRRMGEILIGRRCGPTSVSVLSAFAHYNLAISILGVGQRPALYLAGATFFGRRALMRPFGQRRTYRGRVVKNAYRLSYDEFVALGRLVLKSAAMLGVQSSHAIKITVSYFKGVEAGRFNNPIVVHPLAGITSGSGDHPLDTFLPHLSLTPSLPKFNSKIRRASGKICGRAEYPVGLDVSLEDQKAERQAQRETVLARNRIQTTAAPSTDWLFE